MGPYEPSEGRRIRPGPALQPQPELRAGAAGIAPPGRHRTTFSRVPAEPEGQGDDRLIRERWAARPPLRPASRAWRYLADERCIPPEILAAAARLDAVREGHRASAWFAHRGRGEVCHVEARGPDWKGSLARGTKTLFPFGIYGPATWRTVVTEAPIDALSIAAIEQAPAGTLYVATGGGMGPATIAAPRSLLSRLASSPDALLAIATDADHAGDRYAGQLAGLAQQAGVETLRLRPPDGLDWNEVIKERRKR